MTKDEVEVPLAWDSNHKNYDLSKPSWIVTKGFFSKPKSMPARKSKIDFEEIEKTNWMTFNRKTKRKILSKNKH